MDLGCCPESNGRFLGTKVVQMYVLMSKPKLHRYNYP